MNNIIPAFTKFSITKELLKLMVANTGLTGYVGDNFYPILAPEKDTNGNEITECIVYYREKYQKQYIQNNVVINELCHVTFVVVSSGYGRSIEITELLNNTIEGVHENTDGYKYQCRLIDSDENVIGLNNDKYIQVLTFEIK